MGKLRSVDTHFWSDNYVIDLDPIEKLLFLYLLTNENTNMLGIYELHIRKIAFETGIDKTMIEKIFERFKKNGKASYVSGHVCLHNFTKHQKYNRNMKVSAILSFKELPEKVRQQPFISDLMLQMEPFPKGYEPFAKIRKKKGKGNKKEESKKVLLFDVSSNDYNRDGSKAEKIDWTTVRFHEKIRDRYGHHKSVKKANLETWRDPIRLMIEQDDLSLDDIWKYIKFALSNDFWKDTIKSTSGLRNNWEEIDSSLNRSNNSNNDKPKMSYYQDL